VVLNAQQSTTNSLFNLNRLSFNPAYAGASEKIPITVHIRQQWMGFTDAPRSQYVSTHAFLPFKLGIGGEVYNNITGPTRQTGLKLALAKHFNLDREVYFSFGLSAELYQNLFDTQKLETSRPNDPALQGDIKQSLAPDASLGGMVYADNFFGSFSVTPLIQTSIDLLETNKDFNNPVNRTYYLNGGYVFDFENDFKYKPSVLVKKTVALPVQADICNLVTYQNKLSGGFSFRTNYDLSLLFGYRYYFLEFWYAYDISFSEIKSYNSGSQEIILRVNINNMYRNEKKYGRNKDGMMYDW
jgi:type IX secretion system PorP/SprF family membrane protein